MKERFVKLPDGTLAYVTIDGDMIDQIARTYFGEHAQYSEAILNANPGLSSLPALLPAGVTVRMPLAPSTPKTKPFRRLWN